MPYPVKAKQTSGMTGGDSGMPVTRKPPVTSSTSCAARHCLRNMEASGYVVLWLRPRSWKRK